MAGDHNAMDYPEHERTYSLFITMVKWGTGSVIAILLLMWLFLL